MPKLAIFAATVEEATKTVRPAVEKILSELDIPLSSILVNTGDTTVTKDEDIRNFRNLDVQGTAERVGTVAPCSVSLCSEARNQRYLCCRLQCDA